MDANDIKRLIQYHKDGLDQYKGLMAPAAQYLEEQTIVALELLKKILEEGK